MHHSGHQIFGTDSLGAGENIEIGNSFAPGVLLSGYVSLPHQVKWSVLP
jgi:hypothetical protein